MIRVISWHLAAKVLMLFAPPSGSADGPYTAQEVTLLNIHIATMEARDDLQIGRDRAPTDHTPGVAAGAVARAAAQAGAVTRAGAGAGARNSAAAAAGAGTGGGGGARASTGAAAGAGPWAGAGASVLLSAGARGQGGGHLDQMEEDDDDVVVVATSHAMDGKEAEEEEEEDPCVVCASREECGMMVCRKCKLSTHSFCYYRKGSTDEGNSISLGDAWICGKCGGPHQHTLEKGKGSGTAGNAGKGEGASSVGSSKPSSSAPVPSGWWCCL